nr:MAG: hypothetical protein H3Bulk412432_000001 [Mitovirus sp.]
MGLSSLSLEDMENMLFNLDSIETELSCVALHPRTGERLVDQPTLSTAPNRFVRMWRTMDPK